MSQIVRQEVFKIRVPLGREIGDNNCAYHAFDVCAVRLVDGQGLSGWGFGEAAHGGTFRKPVSWKAEMEGEAGLRSRLESVSSQLAGCGVADLLEKLPRPWEPWPGPRYLLSALRMALWDLRGRQAGLPLYRLLGGQSGATSLFAYASPCCFPQPDEWVANFFRAKIAEGFCVVKVKVGHPDIEWDMRRLRLVREAVGADVEIAVDGNTAWDGAGTVCWMERVIRENLNISYVEDPVAPDDLKSWELLTREAPLPMVGHDYVPDPAKLRPLLDTGALRAIRMRDGIDHGMAAARLADEYGLALIGCNTFGEHGIHFSLTHPRVRRIEFADLGWNKLFLEPVRVHSGRLVPPTGNGLGLEPDPQRMNEWRVQDS